MRASFCLILFLLNGSHLNVLDTTNRNRVTNGKEIWFRAQSGACWLMERHAATRSGTIALHNGYKGNRQIGVWCATSAYRRDTRRRAAWDSFEPEERCGDRRGRGSGSARL